MAKSLLFGVVEPIPTSSMHVMINQCVIFGPVLCVYWWWGQSVCGALERVQIFI